jgi:hypothetical protein
MNPVMSRSPGDCSLLGNRRKTPHMMADFCTTMSANGIPMTGSGIVRDLASMGCQIEIENVCPINKSSVIEVCLQVPDLGWSILIDEAVVQWVKGNRFGLFFVSVRATEGDRLAWIITRRAL